MKREGSLKYCSAIKPQRKYLKNIVFAKKLTEDFLNS